METNYFDYFKTNEVEILNIDYQTLYWLCKLVLLEKTLELNWLFC